MKRIGNLYSKICTIDNIKRAYYNAIHGKRHYKEVIEIEKHVDETLSEILESLKNHTYKTSKYHVFKLNTDHGKERVIYKLPMRDRIVQHAIMNYLEPIFRKSFITDTYSSIKERGIHKGLSRVKRALKDRPNTKYCLQLDIHKFYPSVDQELMKKALRRKFKDAELMAVTDEIIESTDQGLPIGNYTSQYFANFFLTPFDHWIKETLGVKYYFRYCDDIVILGPTKEYLREILTKIKPYLESIKLELKPNYQIFPVEARSINFLGYKSRHDFILVRKYIKQNFIKKIKGAKTIDEYRKICGAYWGIFCHANCTNLWYKYTGVKTFEDLGINIKSRINAKNMIGQQIEVHDMEVENHKGNFRVLIHARHNNRDLIIYSFAEMILEAAKEISKLKSNFPFTATIVEENGFIKLI